jgi:hypothetical protein
MSSQKVYIPNLIGLQALAFDLINEDDLKQPGAELVNHREREQPEPDYPIGPWINKPFDYIPDNVF